MKKSKFSEIQIFNILEDKMNHFFKKRPDRSEFFYITLSILMLTGMILGGCSPTAPSVVDTPTAPPNKGAPAVSSETNELPAVTGNPLVIRTEAGSSYVRLPDGSEIFIQPNTEIELYQVAGLTNEASEHVVLLHYGEVLVNSQLPAGKWFTVISPDGYIARVTGSIMVVGYDEATGEFLTSCVEGDCELGSDAQSLFQLAAQDQGWLDKNGNFLGPFDADLDVLRATYGVVIPTKAVETNTPEGFVSPADLDATATAACNKFHSNFPLTPTCP
ncbi:MAG: hypothetical protein C4586_01565 [Anaerolineaceae bacterium]|nr:MAG: hypothetical protein C4586_01565 [Anaerolineaceae bacterium]